MKDEPEKLKLPSIDETKSAALSKSADDDDDEDSSSLDQSPLWHREDEGWELTWPIWHMLPRDERKALAKRHGYNTIGEFEEYMSLQTAVDETDDHLSQPYSNESVYSPKGPQVTVDSEDKKPAAKEQLKDAVVEVDRDEDDESESGDEQMAEMNRMASTCTEDLSPEELMELGGKILILPDEILHRVFSWLPVDAYGILALVSPHWKHLTRTESVYRRLCERLYLNQSKKRQLHVSKFGNSYRKMLELRPRVRAAGGCYVLKYSCVKPIQRDMWTEIPVGAILETVYYRYMYFQEDGRVLYALSSAPPHLMFRRLLKVCLEKIDDPAAVWGTFQIQKDKLTVIAKQDWHTVKFDLTIQPKSIYGRWGTLTLNSHFSSASANFDPSSYDLVEYKVPVESFFFVKDGRL